jgi:hypothetical protein
MAAIYLLQHPNPSVDAFLLKKNSAQKHGSAIDQHTSRDFLKKWYVIMARLEAMTVEEIASGRDESLLGLNIRPIANNLYCLYLDMHSFIFFIHEEGIVFLNESKKGIEGTSLVKTISETMKNMWLKALDA